jgi:hypothetical protein
MNVAFTALFIIFLLLPGIILRKSYLSTKFSARFFISSFQDELYWALIPSLLFHFIGYWVSKCIFNYDIQLNKVGILLIGTNDHLKISEIFNSCRYYFNQIIAYNLIIWVFAFFIGHYTRIIVRRYFIDILFPTLRFSNIWYYWFTGEYRDILTIDSENNGVFQKIILLFKRNYFPIKANLGFVTVDALVSVGNQNIIYSGLLEDFIMDKANGGLDRIIIKYPARRKFELDNTEEILNDKDRWYDIPGNNLSIPYQNIQNLNISYYSLNEDKDGGC